MPLTLFNTATRRKELFHPQDSARVGMYVCGPTVYSYAHIGNARPVIVFDLLFRVLRAVYGPAAVTYVRNITDVDDKIIAAAAQTGETIRQVTERTARQYEADMAAVGALPPTHAPRATEHIPGMIAMTRTLIAKGHAYAVEGHVLFAVGSLADYGALSGRNLDDMIAGARVEVAPYKRAPADFVLWKPAKPDEPGWDSPWGRGRPGWHIECSAMAEAILGETIDIHGGGADLIFPHHENERAQSLCAHDGRPFVNLWMHNAFLDFGGEKMSKSLGNIETVHDLLARFPGEALRYAMLGAHYREPLDWNDARIREAKGALDRFYGALRAVADIDPVWPETPGALAPLLDDLNSPQAQAILHAEATQLNKAKTIGAKAEAKGALLASGQILGLLGQEPEAWFRWRPADAGGLDDAAVDQLVEARIQARAARDFAEADRLRGLLTAAGIAIEDGPDGTVWRRHDL